MNILQTRAKMLTLFAAAALAFAACAYEYPEPFNLDGDYEPVVAPGTATVTFEFRNAVLNDPATVKRAEDALDILTGTAAYGNLSADKGFWTGDFADYSAYDITVSIPDTIEFGGDFGLEAALKTNEDSGTQYNNCVQIFNRINFTAKVKTEIDSDAAKWKGALGYGWYSVLDLAEIVAAGQKDDASDAAKDKADDATKLLSGVGNLPVFGETSGYYWNTAPTDKSKFAYYSHYKSTTNPAIDPYSNIDADDVIAIDGNPSLKKK